MILWIALALQIHSPLPLYEVPQIPAPVAIERRSYVVPQFNFDDKSKRRKRNSLR